MKSYYLQAILSTLIVVTLYFGINLNQNSVVNNTFLTHIFPVGTSTETNEASPLTNVLRDSIINTIPFEALATSIPSNTRKKTSNNTEINTAAPTVDFNFNNDNTCSGTSINFTSIVSGEGPFTYLWNFGDGTTSTQTDPSHKFTALGCGNMDYNVLLVATDKNGETKSTVKTISVMEKPKLEFTDIDNPGDPFNNCGYNTSNALYTINVGILDVSACISSYTIDWGDGSSPETNATFPATHTYTQLGSYNMKITGQGTNCDNEVTYLIKNSSNPTGAIVSPGSTVNLCTPVAPLIFSISAWGNNSPGTIYEVDFGDDETETYTQEELEASSFYNSSDPANSANFPIPHTYTASNCPNDSYNVSLRIATSCNETILTVGPVSILEKPEADFEIPDIGCVSTLIQFDNKSSGYNQNCNPNINYYWDFGDGNTSNFKDPTHEYALPGTYTVSLYSENFCGKSTTATKTICIEPPLIADFNLNTNNGCAPLQVQTTTNLSSSCSGETYLWEVSYTSGFCTTGAEQWSFINGTDDESAAPEFNFETPGTYSLKLTATNSCGSDEITKTIEVKQPPKAEIAPVADFCGPTTINPIATVESCAPASETLTYNWSFPGGSPATANTLDPGTITYATPGNYQISFTVSSSCGPYTDTEDFVINPIPTITNTNLSEIICSGTNTAEVVLTSDIPGTTYAWTATSVPGITGFTTSGTSSTIPSQTLYNATTTSGDVIFSITPYFGGCPGIPVDLIITVDTAPSFTTHPASEAICLNGPIATLSVTTNGPGTPTYQWYSNTTNDNTTGTIITGETNSTYTPPNSSISSTYYYCKVLYISGSACNLITSNTAQIEIVKLAEIDTQPLATQTICSDGIISALKAIHSGGAGTIAYQWYSNTTNSNSGGSAISGATNKDYTPSAFNTVGSYFYYVEISLGGSGCTNITSDVAEVIVVSDPIITTQPVATQTLCQNITPQNLEATASGGIGTTYNYQWFSNTTNSNSGGTLISGATTKVFTPPTANVGTTYYYVEISQSSLDCKVTSNTSEVIVNPAPSFSNQPISNTYCYGDSISPLSATYMDGVGTPTYQWYANTADNTTSGTAIPTATTSTYTPSGSTIGTTYYYAVITFSSGGCSLITSNTAKITINNTPIIKDKNNLMCSGSTFIIDPTRFINDIVPTGTTYTWSNPIISPSGSITGGSSQNIPQSLVSQTLTNTTTSPGTATYTVTPTTGTCTGNSFKVTMTVNPAIIVTFIQTNSSCYTSNSGALDITVSKGLPFSTGDPYKISWKGPNGFSSNSEDISNLEPGDYLLEVLDFGNCPFKKIVTITEPEALSFSSIDFDPETISCNGANDGSIGIEISGGTTPYSYTWTKNSVPYSNSEDLNNLGPGTYEVSVTDANNCAAITQEFTITEPALLEPSLVSQMDVICFGEATGEININTTGGRPTYTYAWKGPNGFTSTNQNLTGLYAGTYSLTVTDRSNCTNTLDVILKQSDDIIINYSATEIKCYGDNDASITIDTITGGNPPYSVNWSNLATGYSQTNLSPGTYIITVTDNENCTKEETVVIADVPIYKITPDVTNVSCYGANDAQIVLNLVGGIAPVTLNWNDDPTAGVERNNIGPGSYTVTITDATQCVITETFVITEPDELKLSGNKTDALDCDDANSGAINLIATGGTLPLTYLWSNGETTEDLSNIPPGNYSVTVTDANNCEISRNWDINRFEPLEINITAETDFDCDTKTFNQSFIAEASGGVPPYTYSWSSGTVSGTNGEMMNTTFNGLVIIEVTDNIGCTSTLSYNVENPILGDPDFSSTSNTLSTFDFYSIQDPIQFTNTSTPGFVSVSWDFGDGNFSGEENPEHTYFKVGTFTVTQTVTFAFGCVYTKTIDLIITNGYKLIMPNAFTPNGDALNPNFAPISLGLTDLEFNIFDTWGSLIYSEKGDNLQGWNGEIKDNDAENGNYYFTLTAKTFYGETITRKGKFTSIK